MHINLHIISEELGFRRLSGNTVFSHEMNLQGVRFFDGGVPEDADSFLYLDRADAFARRAVTGGVRHLVLVGPAESVPAVFQYGQEVVCCETESDLLRVFNRIQDVFLKYGRLEEALNGAFLEKRTLPEIMAVISGFFPNPLVMCDNRGLVVACSDNVPPDYSGFWQYIFPHGYYDYEAHRKNNLRSPFRFKDAIYWHKPIWIQRDVIDCPVIMFNIFSGSERCGDVHLPETYAPLTDGQYSLMGYIQDRLENYVRYSGIRIVANAENHPIVRSILDGRKVTAAEIHRARQPYGFQPDEPYYVIVVRTRDDPSIKNAELTYCLQWLSRELPGCAVLDYRGCGVLIPRVADYPLSETAEGGPVRLLSCLEKLHQHIDCKFGVSGVRTDVEDLRLAYRQAMEAVDSIRNSTHDLYVSCFEDQYHELLRQKIGDAETRMSFCQPSVLKLRRYDLQNNTEFVRTLREMIRHGMRLQEVADLLFIHRNSLTYRLKRIRDISGIDLYTAADADKLLVSCLMFDV